MCWTYVLDQQSMSPISEVTPHPVQVHARVTFIVSDLMQNQDPSVTGLALHRMRHDASVSWPRAGKYYPICKGCSTVDAHGCL